MFARDDEYVCESDICEPVGEFKYYLIDLKISIKKLLLSRVTICLISSIIFTIFYLIFK